jgi:hypothetical protein
MDKRQAIFLSGGTQKHLAEVIGVTQQAASKIPADLPRKWQDRIVGALLRNRLISPETAISLL